MRWLDSITDPVAMNLNKLTEDRGPGMRQFMGSRRVGHGLATEEQQQRRKLQ